uniref:Uncharacterized protein LOC111116025 n=1 Tax=Crassostrea virginica TaxID=6565 RepID=A0A8B8C4R5_CRAVI|nr:uncharacterized protein LOC111116025 [Crassostrea virginica]
MAMTVLEKRLIVLYVVTIALWLISMFTQGWIVESFDYANGTCTLVSIQTSLFYYKVCNLEVCETKLGTDENPLMKTMPTWTEMQSMSITAVVLCAVCCLLVILPDPCSWKKFERPIAVVLIIFNIIAVLIESALIIRVIIYITTASENFYLAEHLSNKNYKGLTYNIKMPYSIIIAYVGLFVAITGCVLGCVHHSSLKRRSREHLGQNRASAAYASSVEPTNQQNHMHYMEYGQPPYEQHPYEQPPDGRNKEHETQNQAAYATTVELTYQPHHMHDMVYRQPPYGQPPHGQPPYGRNKEHETQNQAIAAYAPTVELTNKQNQMHYMEYGQPPYEQPLYGRNKEHKRQNQASAEYAPNVELTNKQNQMHYMEYGQPPYEQPPHGQPPYGRNKEHQRQNQASAAYAPTVALDLSSGWTTVAGSVYI